MTAARAMLFVAAVSIVVYWLREAITAGLLRIAFPLYARLKKDELLNHEARALILELLRQNPGLNFSELRALLSHATGGPYRTGLLNYHLAKLKEYEQIRAAKTGYGKRYFSVDGPVNGEADMISLLRTKPVDLIARTIIEAPKSSLASLLARVRAHRKMGRYTLQYHIDRLLELKLVARTKVGKQFVYAPTDHLTRLAPILAEPAPAQRAEVKTRDTSPAQAT